MNFLRGLIIWAFALPTIIVGVKSIDNTERSSMLTNEVDVLMIDNTVFSVSLEVQLCLAFVLVDVGTLVTDIYYVDVIAGVHKYIRPIFTRTIINGCWTVCIFLNEHQSHNWS